MTQPQAAPFSFDRWLHRSRLCLLFALFLIPVIPLMGCYGEFALTKAVYEFNGDVSDNEFVQSLVTWVLGFLFVYSAAVLIDFVILNLIEFWTDQNPMTAKQTLESPDGSQVVMTPNASGNEVRIDMIRNGETVETRRVVKTASGKFEIFDDGGQAVGRVNQLGDGALELSRPDSEEKAILTRDMIEGFKAGSSRSM